MSEPRVLPIERLITPVEPYAWGFAVARRADIDAHFDACRARLPHLWNGRVLAVHRHTLVEGVLDAGFFETDYASFLAWRDWGFLDASVTNAFAMGALRASDGAFLLGEMSAGTANAGLVYFPCGTPDPSDIRDGAVDLSGSIAREIREETGLEAADYEVGRWWVVPDGPRLALMRVLRARLDAPALRARILAHLAREADPELADVRVVREEQDLDPAMPDFVRAFIRHVWRSESASGET